MTVNHEVIGSSPIKRVFSIIITKNVKLALFFENRMLKFLY